MDSNAKPVSVPPVLTIPTVAEPAVVVTPVRTPAASGQPSHQDRAASQAENAARYSLVIEEGPTHGTFVYKTLDRMTGEIVRQFPREQVLRMAESGGYAAGGLIDTSA